MNLFREKKFFVKAINWVIRGNRSADKVIRDNEILYCPVCDSGYRRIEYRENQYVCPHCGRHGRLTVSARIQFLLDPDSFREISRGIVGNNPLCFPGYKEKLEEAQRKSHLKEAVVTGTGKIGGIKIVIGVMDCRFMMASMGTAVGEKITQAFEFALRRRRPIVIITASGGARMQEGILSLFQMSKTAVAVARHSEAGLLYVSILTDPTTGGVTASFASLADIILAEPGAHIGFAGSRVIKQTIGEMLPDGFQRAEFQREHGFVDAVVARPELRNTLIRLLRMHSRR